MYKLNMISLGCAKVLVDSEILLTAEAVRRMTRKINARCGL